ncbi:hypothetical protein L3Q82_009263 [Scortum barcoo]|uniref:Uncharacterized protein n=1 Tax=Scortum barcoo TaxID=214431 RepID=A0ACB8WGK4_9TELE|nr:hypothetical protein L3Q82_009263 [Scortum barcoo]
MNPHLGLEYIEDLGLFCLRSASLACSADTLRNHPEAAAVRSECNKTGIKRGSCQISLAVLFFGGERLNFGALCVVLCPRELVFVFDFQCPEHGGATRRQASTSGDVEEAVGGQQPSSRTTTSTFVQGRNRRSTARALQNDLQQATNVSVQTVRLSN